LAHNARRPSWFLHVHMWDPHTPYRTPSSYGDPFEDQPVPEWLTEEVRRVHWDLPGPHSAQEVAGFEPRAIWDGWPRQPQQIAGPADVRRMFDGYDVGIRFADHHIGQILDALDREGVADETAVMVSSDHGENLGELGIYCDHQTADEHTTHIPFVLRWPGQVAPGTAEGGFHYQFDLMATVIELFGGSVPAGWDGMSFAPSLRSGQPAGRSHLVLSHGAWTAQRSVRFGDWLLVRTYFDAYHGFPPVMLFDVAADPYEQRNRSVDRADVAARGVSLLDAWEAEGRSRAPAGVDPLWTTMREGGPWHSRVDVDWYFDRLRGTGRGQWADHFDTLRRRTAPRPPSVPGATIPSRIA
jgi:choline-sulfatase